MTPPDVLRRATTRREFLEIAARLSVAFGLSQTLVPRLAEATERVFQGRAPVLWLQGQSCSGCSISLLNCDDPGPVELITQHIALKYHPTLSAATGSTAIRLVEDWIDEGRPYVLAVEGSLPTAMPSACQVGEAPLQDLVVRGAARATAVLAVGTCAAFGGIPAAEGNSTGAHGVSRLLDAARVTTPVIRIPGCPAHPDWMVGTLVHLLEVGLPEVDSLGRPKAFFERLVHDQCPRFADYERELFARDYGDLGCLFRLGCLGPRTHADCTLRLWNSGAGCCINDGAPCIGCAAPDFALSRDVAFSRFGERGTTDGEGGPSR